MLLPEACGILGWPDPATVLTPRGAGAAVCAASVARRIGEPLRRAFPGVKVETGVLTAAPESPATPSPLAIVCQFPRGATPEQLAESHRLAWNFSSAPLLITLEPSQLVAWSCWQDPGQPNELRIVGDSVADRNQGADSMAARTQLRQLLHWVSLVTGHILRRRPECFPVDGRADRLLLKNLRHARRRLLDDGLSAPVCHDLLARVIFTQFLFHRRDSAGTPFFSEKLLDRLCDDGTLSCRHVDLESILRNRRDTYELFRWMDERFNGDLFPGKENQSDAEREESWKDEKREVTADHLRALAELVSGAIDTTDRQLRLWPAYSFDTIPLEFISSVYEEFLNEDRGSTKAYYTPSHLVDYVLDAVLPWDGAAWDIDILDPACGSGIFLVKSFQRLIHRWRKEFRREPLVSDLKPLLAKCLRGIDINPDAVRVACFSLYLAMVDAIDPRHYVTREKVFPRLRGTRLICGDFFDERRSESQDGKELSQVDLVVGNAPWGDASVRATSKAAPVSTASRASKSPKSPTSAQVWAERSGWPIVNNDIGPLFLAKGLDLLKPRGRIAMLQPAMPWLYHRAAPALKLRRRLFEDFTVDEVTNLVAVRRELFHDVIGPACVVVACKETPAPDKELRYFVPKPVKFAADFSELRIDPQDVASVSHMEAAEDPLIWSVLALGGRRDVLLIRRLMPAPNLRKLKADGRILTRMGVIPGDRRKELPELRNKPYFDAPAFPGEVFLELLADHVAGWADPRVDSLHGIAGYDEFKVPQVLVKHSYSTEAERFRAAWVNSSDPEWGVICKETYLSVHDCESDARHLAPICLTYNSRFATYFLALTSSRFPYYNREVPTNELMTVPLPTTAPDPASVATFEQLDQTVSDALGLNVAERTLVDDLLDVALVDALRQAPGPGRKPTKRTPVEGEQEPELSEYGGMLIRVLEATFGSDKDVAVTIYQDPASLLLPVRMITLHLNWEGRPRLSVEPLAADELWDRLCEFQRTVLERNARSTKGAAWGFGRVAFLVAARRVGKGRVQDVTIIKPDECRFWTRSQAMRDADELAASILKAAERSRKRP